MKYSFSALKDNILTRKFGGTTIGRMFLKKQCLS